MIILKELLMITHQNQPSPDAPPPIMRISCSSWLIASMFSSLDKVETLEESCGVLLKGSNQLWGEMRLETAHYVL